MLESFEKQHKDDEDRKAVGGYSSALIWHCPIILFRLRSSVVTLAAILNTPFLSRA